MPEPMNAHGLNRHIPNSIKAEVRRRSKFGCVVCRGAICDYEHILPEFKDATEHDPACICLLCPSCHAKVTRRHMSKRSVARAYASTQNNEKLLCPFSQFEFEAGLWFIELGSSKFIVPKAVFTVDGIEILSFCPPEEPGHPPPSYPGSSTTEEGVRF